MAERKICYKAANGWREAHNDVAIRLLRSFPVQVPLSDQIDVAGFHTEASRLLAQQVPPETVQWCAVCTQSVEEEELDPAHLAIRGRAARAIIPQSFVRMSELVGLHREPGRFDLLYRALWRLVHEPELKNDASDLDLARLRQMAQAVRRDIHKMKNRLAFRALPVGGQLVAVAWYEPAHYVAETVAAWLARCDPSAHWILLTPDRSMRWDGERLLRAPAVAPMRDGERLDDAGWSRVLEGLPWS